MRHMENGPHGQWGTGGNGVPQLITVGVKVRVKGYI